MDSRYTTGLELILNACEGVLQIAVTDNEKLQCFEEWFRPKMANELLTPALQEICGRLDIKIRDFRRIGCFSGPGSFTGIRLVLTTAAALRRAGRAQLAGLDYLQALATTAVMHRGILYPAKVIVITHARRDLVHYREFISYGPKIPAQGSSDTELLTPQEALAKFAATPCFVCGSGLARYPALFEPRQTGKGPVEAPQAVVLPEVTRPDAPALCLLARHGDYFPEDVEPVYVRPCDAVENLEELTARFGYDGKQAREQLHNLLEWSNKGDA